MLTLTEFLLARLGEVEASTKYDEFAHSGPGSVGFILADCAAKRRIVELHTPDHECTDGSDSYPGVMGEGMYEPYCPTLRALALPYADHPDYDESWRP